MWKCFLALFVVINCFLISEPCACTADHPLRSLGIYCNSDWVAEVTVTHTRLFDNYHLEYSINYTTVYKMPEKFNDNYPTKIYTNRRVFACGRALSENLDVLLAGFIFREGGATLEGEIYITRCLYLNDEFEQKLRSNAAAIDCSELKKE